ncbi:MAG: leucine-rich repeat protein [Clostridia bacterium]|nr:leucine-rich repeat protein [Clostridia bacterium]
MKRAKIIISSVLSVVIMIMCFASLNTSVLAEESDGFIYRVEGNSAILTGLDNSVSGEVVVPQKLDSYSVTVIDGAFMNRTDITKVILPEGLLRINAKSFYACTGLASVYIPNSVTDIGEYAFQYCSSLTSVSLPSGMKRVKKGTFYECGSLSSIDIPENISFIEQYAFYNTAYYKNTDNWDSGVIYVGKHLLQAKTYVAGTYEIRQDTKSISDYAFNSCLSLTAIIINKELKTVGESVCYNCKNLTDIYYSGTFNDRRKIVTGKDNQKFNNATWHYKQYQPGDINGDDEVNNKDVVRLFRYLSGWSVEVETTTLDVNGDNSVNNKDYTRLFQYLSGWSVEVFSENPSGTIGGDDYGPVVHF